MCEVFRMWSRRYPFADVDSESYSWSPLFVAIKYVVLAGLTPSVGKILPVKSDSTNKNNNFAVAVLKNGVVVERVP